MHSLPTRTLGSIALRTLAVAAFLSLFSPSLAPAHSIDARTRAVRPPLLAGTMPERNSVAAFRPRHVLWSNLRTDRRGDTAPSKAYFKLTNVTAEVGGLTGSAAAVNRDGRIGYTDYGNGEDIPGTAYVVNNGGTFARLFGPYDGFACEFPEVDVTALNENAEAVGAWSCGGTNGFIGWSLSGATGSSIRYFDQSGQESAAYAVNDHNVAVGCYGPCYTGAAGSAILTEPSSGSKGRVIALRGFKGRTCPTAATSINDSGKIVGFACNEAALFSTSGYATALGLGSGSAAEAVNQHGDIVGSAGSSAFLERDGRTLKLPKPAPYGSYSAIAYAVNAADEVVGTLYGPHGTAVAFVYTNGHIYALDSLLPPNSGWKIADALGVNDHGEIVGDAYYSGTLYGVSLKPPQ